MNQRSTSSQEELNKIKKELIDPLAVKLTDSVKWLYIDDLSTHSSDTYPIAIVGKGKPILLLHGFDSCFMEFRRLVPYLENEFQLIIPDLYGFGFCPRAKESQYGMKHIINHLEKILKTLKINSPCGVIGASMGGAVAMELARREKSALNKLLLLSPAGLTGISKPIPAPLAKLGACFLYQSFVREGLCKRAFSNPKEVGFKEKQIASIHIQVPGWGESLSAFAKAGGIANYGLPLPKNPIKILWGKDDKILGKELRENCIKSLKCDHQELTNCGHLPHIEKPEIVASAWKNSY